MNAKKLALANISKYGDTDIFPYPIENSIFYDLPKESKVLLESIDKNFEAFINNYPVEKMSTCIPVGFGGFRWATQIDPIWNAYLLSSTLDIFQDIESKRIPVEKNYVYSYRKNEDSKSVKLFSQEVNWKKFMNDSVSFAESSDYSFVVKFDISDFYTRIYHHRLENSLNRATRNVDKVKKIVQILQDLSNNTSYGLPVGGNAARILAELFLNNIDQYLFSKRIRFFRFVDDFILFAKTKEEAFRHLNTCADFLYRNEGLSIQKTKTQVISTEEFISQTRHLLIGDEEDNRTSERASFLSLHVFYDPYSSTATQDYENLKEKISKFDINQLIKEEIRKSRIHKALGKHLLNAISFLEPEQIGLSLQSISTNFEVFYPIFPSVLRLASKSLEQAPVDYQNDFVAKLCTLVDSDSYLLQNDNNQAYLVRVLSKSNLDISDQIIEKIYDKTTSPMVKSNCMYSMTNKRREYWISDKKSNFATMSRPERRAFIAASYGLGDEGKYWREHTKSQFVDLEKLTREWISKKVNNNNQNWMLPI